MIKQLLNCRRYLYLCFILPVLLLTIAYAGGYITQFIVNYHIWTAAGGTPGNATAPAFPSASLSACFHALLHFPDSVYGLLLCIGAFGLLIFMVMRMGAGNKENHDRDRNLIYSNKGTYGTSGFMTDQERENVLELVTDVSLTRGTILGLLRSKAVCLPENSRLNRNVAVFGASGSMKSRAYARNVIFQCVKRGESLIITDPKSELYGDMYHYLKSNDYTVRVFNLINPENSDSWNCLTEIGDNSGGGKADGENGDTEIMAQLFSDVIIKNTGSVKGDRFWDNSEMNLLKALVLYVYNGFPAEERNIGQVYQLLTMNTEKQLNCLFDLLPVTHPAKAPYNIFTQASDTVRSGVIIGLGTRLQVFQNKLIRRITAHDEIDLTLPGYEKCAYFCITSDQDSTFDFLSSLFMSFVFIKLVRYADRYGADGRLPVPVHILADELANGGCTIADLTKKISTIRSRALSISCIFQNLPQMQNRYPLNQWQEIIGNCDTQLFLGCTDEMTAEFISNRSGETSIALSSQAKQLNTWRISDYSPDYRETQSVGKRLLLTPDEVMRLPLNQALIILRGQKLLKVEKYDYTLHPESSKLVHGRACEHIPAWKKHPEAKAESEPAVSTSAKTSNGDKRNPNKAPGSKPPGGTKQTNRLSSEDISHPPLNGDSKIILTDKQFILSR